jgi:hypothetical protein
MTIMRANPASTDNHARSACWTVLAALLLSTPPLTAQRTNAELQESRMRTCPAADSAIGKMRKIGRPTVRIFYLPDHDASMIVTHLRATSWTIGKSRVVGMEGRIPVPGHPPAEKLAFEFALMLLDSVQRAPSELPLMLVLDRRDTLRASDPQVRPFTDLPKLNGVPFIVRFGLTTDETRRLAAAKEASGMLGPHTFFLYDWELVDLEAVYRVARCGAG